LKGQELEGDVPV